MKRNLSCALITTIAILYPTLSYAQDVIVSEPITTDRPDFTESGLVVPKGRFQVESGFTSVRGRHDRTFDLPEVLLRWGTARNFEWRLGLPNYNVVHADGEKSTGFDDTYFGAKFQLGPTKQGLDVSLIPAVFVPTGSRDFRSDTVDPEIKLCVGTELSPLWSVSGMLYGARPTEEGKRNTTLQTTVSFGYSLTERLNSFYEYAGTFPDRGETEHFFHSGLAYLLNDNAQADIHFGFGLSPDAPRSLIAAGYSVRF